MQRQMPKRITITLPNPVYEGLVALSKVKDKPPATLAAEAVEKLVEETKEAVEILPTEVIKEGDKGGDHD